MEIENTQLNESLRNLEANNNQLAETINALERKLKSEKKIHQDFVDDVAASEVKRTEDFAKEKLAILDENKSLAKENRQLTKDKTFYQSAHQELASKEEQNVNQHFKPHEELLQSAGAFPPTSTHQSFSRTDGVLSKDVAGETTSLSVLSNSKIDFETENSYLTDRINALEKTLDKERKFHRKFSDETAASEVLRNRGFQNEKRTIIEEKKSLVKENRELKKERDFYKNEHEKLTNEEDTTVHSFSELAVERPSTSSKTTRRSTSRAIVAKECMCVHKSSKVLSTVNKKLFEENKKLKLKMNTLNATIAILKQKNKRLENFRIKVDAKKAKFCEDSEELARLVDSTLKKNKHTFNPEALTMLGSLKKK